MKNIYEKHSKRWVRKHFLMAAMVSCYSKDNSTKCGAVIVRPDNSVASTGYNGFPRGVEEKPERLERPAKYLFTEHAERNAIYNCGDPSLEGYSLFVFAHPNNLFICSDCSRAIIQEGITEIYAPLETDIVEHWGDSCAASKIMLQESGVEIFHVELPDYTRLTETILDYEEKNI